MICDLSKRNNLLLLEDIDESCAKILKYVENQLYDDFITDDKTIDAVIRNFEIIGEAANNLTDEIYQNYPNAQGRKIIGLRNRLIHGYFGVDYKILWQVIKENLPSFKADIENVIKDLSK